MGGTSTTQQQTVQQPWRPAQSGLKKIIGATENQIGNIGPSSVETNALNQLQANAGLGNPYASQIGDVTSGLLGGGPDRSGMVSDAYAAYAPAATGAASAFTNATNQNMGGYNANAGQLSAGLNSNVGGFENAVAGYGSSIGRGLQDFEAGTQGYTDNLNKNLGGYETGVQNYGTSLGKGLGDYEAGLSPYLSANYLDPSQNPATASLIQSIQDRISNQVNGQFAAAGRDMSGANQKTLASGVTEGIAPVLFNQYNQNVATQRGAQDALMAARSGTAGSIYGSQGDLLGARNNTAGMGYDAQGNLLNARTGAAGGILDSQNNLMGARNAATAGGYDANAAALAAGERGAQSIYGAQNTAAGNIYDAGNNTAGLLSGLDQTRFGNQVQGAGMTDAATAAQNYGPTQTLMIEAMRRGIPIEQLQQLTGILGPIAGLGGTSNSSGSNTMSGAAQFATIASGIGNLMPKTPMKMG